MKVTQFRVEPPTRPAMDAKKFTTIRYDNQRVAQQWGLLSMRSFNQRQIRVHLHAIEHDFGPVGGDVEIVYDEVRRKLGDCVLGTGSKVHERKVLVNDFAAKNHYRLRFTKKHHPARAPREHHTRQRIWPSIRGGGTQRKGRPNVRT